jgi:hypothetical protein
MIFFDNEHGNCQTVAAVGVTVMYTPVNINARFFM